MDIDSKDVFQQLVAARFGRSPYDKFRTWLNPQLWKKIAEVVYDVNPYNYEHPPSVADIGRIVKKFHRHYVADRSLSRMVDRSFKEDICFVFGTVLDYKGSLSDHDLELLETSVFHLEAPVDTSVFHFEAPVNNPPYYGSHHLDPAVVNLLCSEELSSERVGYEEDLSWKNELIARLRMKEKQALPAEELEKEIVDFWKNIGTTGPLASQYVNDVMHLPITESKKMWLAKNYGATSNAYVNMSNYDPETRKKHFLELASTGHRSNSSGSSVNSNQKRRK